MRYNTLDEYWNAGRPHLLAAGTSGGAQHGTPVMAQVLRRQSQHGKGGTKDISSLYLQAVNNTTNFVYIGNQYFRHMPVADKLHAPASPPTPAT